MRIEKFDIEISALIHTLKSLIRSNAYGSFKDLATIQKSVLSLEVFVKHHLDQDDHEQWIKKGGKHKVEIDDFTFKDQNTGRVQYNTLMFLDVLAIYILTHEWFLANTIVEFHADKIKDEKVRKEVRSGSDAEGLYILLKAKTDDDRFLQQLWAKPEKQVSVKETIREVLKELESQPKGDSELMSLKQIAELFGVSLVTIHVWRNANILPPSIKQGGKVFFHRADIDRLLAEKKEEGRNS